jgi:hypothetical protein
MPDSKRTPKIRPFRIPHAAFRAPHPASYVPRSALRAPTSALPRNPLDTLADRIRSLNPAAARHAEVLVTLLDAVVNRRLDPAALRPFPFTAGGAKPEPAPRPYLVDRLIPEGVTTLLYGHGGIGKSYVLVHLAIHVALGLPWLGLATQPRPVLLVDAELDPEESLRRCYQVARGLGLAAPPDTLLLTRLRGSLANPVTRARVLTTSRIARARAVFLDSLSIAAHGAALEGAGDVTAILRGIEDWGTVVAIDHHAKPGADANLSHYSPFGSVFKTNLARSVVQLIGADGGGLLLRHRKANFGPLLGPLNAALAFEGDTVTLRRVGAAGAEMAGIDAHLSALDRVWYKLAETPDGLTPAALAAALTPPLSEARVRTYLSALRRQDRAEPARDGAWRPRFDDET